MKTSKIKIRVKNKIFDLTQKEYKAAGGFGTVYCIGDTAYKIYHDPKNMIPEAKIHELSHLNLSNILSPIEPIYEVSGNTPIGFTMKFINGVEYLCQIFTKTFRTTHNMTPTDVKDLVLNMQKTLQYIHHEGFLVVDYNEMNFLLSKDLKMVYYIDVDAWKTKNFPATAINNSIRDRQVKGNNYTVLSDWFSWAVVTFQMYIGIHPYKGFHNRYKPKEWMKRMDDNISIFDPEAKPLPDTCQSYSAIPKKHFEWYKKVFRDNERSIPPLPDSVQVLAAVARTITSKGDFIIQKVFEVNEPIQNIFFLHNERYVLTHKAIYNSKDEKIIKYTRPLKLTTVGICELPGKEPLIGFFKNLKVSFYDFKKQLIEEADAEDVMWCHNICYVVNNGYLIENYFEYYSKPLLLTRIACNISSSYKVYTGVIVQDIFTKIHLVIPFSREKCINIHAKELDGQRIVDAKYDKGVCIIISEQQGQYFRNILCFNESHDTYTIKREDIVDYYPVNFIVLPNKMCLFLDNDVLSLFKNNEGSRNLTGAPVDVTMKLHHEHMQVFFVDDNKLYSMKMKS